MEQEQRDREAPLSERAYQIIKGEITSGVLRPGDPLTEERLSDQISISRTPLRAALQRLAYEGLAQGDANRGLRVTDVTAEEVAQITVVRKELEVLAVRLLRERRTTEGFGELRALCDREQALALCPVVDHQALIQVDYELHMALAAMTGNQFLLDTMQRIKTSSSRYLILSGTMEKYGVTGTHEHDVIVSFLEKGQYDYAELAVRDHIVDIGRRILV